MASIVSSMPSQQAVSAAASDVPAKEAALLGVCEQEVAVATTHRANEVSDDWVEEDGKPKAGFTTTAEAAMAAGLARPLEVDDGDGTAFELRIGPDYKRLGKKEASAIHMYHEHSLASSSKYARTCTPPSLLSLDPHSQFALAPRILLLAPRPSTSLNVASTQVSLSLP